MDEYESLLVVDMDERATERFNVAIIRVDDVLIRGFVMGFEELMMLKRFHHLRTWLVGVGEPEARLQRGADRLKFINLDFKRCDPAFAEVAIYGKDRYLIDDLPRLDYFLHGGRAGCESCDDWW